MGRSQVIWAVAGAAVLGCTLSSCLLPLFHRNENLKLVRSDGYYYNLCRAVLSPKGGMIYYLRGPDGSVPKGALWEMSTDGSTYDKISWDTFAGLAVDQSGRTLALLPADDTTGMILLYHPNDETWDTIRTSIREMVDVQFGRASPAMIYVSTSSSGIWRTDTAGMVAELVDSAPRDAYFAPMAGDSLAFSHHPRPAVHPSGYYLALPAYREGCHEDMAIVNLLTGDTAWQNANPWRRSYIRWPCWSPDGASLVFTSDEAVGGCPPTPEDPFGGEIWELKQVDLPVGAR